MGLFDRIRSSDSKAAFIGIDGVPVELVDDHPDIFPNLHSIADEGIGTRISSIVPPESSACWPSLTTGRNPGATGVYGFQDREKDSYETYIPLSHHVKAKRVWRRVEESGGNATVLNVPVTYPPVDDVQRMVSGFLSPSLEKAASNDEVLGVLRDNDYRIDVDASLGHNDDKSDFIEDAHEVVDARYEVFRHYIEMDDWDLFFGVFMTSDRVNHFLYGDYATDDRYREEFLEFYSKLDGYIGDLRDRLSDDASLLIASDHGFTRLEYEANCNEFLRRNNWFSLEGEEDDGLDDISHESRAYSLIPGRFYLNLEGREPEGAVSRDEYSKVLEGLERDLENWESPDGRSVCRRIVRGEDVFSGGETDIAPDLVVIPGDGFDLKSKFKDEQKLFSEGPRNGMHKFENALLYSDESLNLSGDEDLYNVAPTILDLLDIEYSESDLDGGSLVGS